VNQASANAAGRAQPGALMHQASDGMGAGNFQVHPPERGRQVIPEALNDNAAAGRPGAAVCIVAGILGASGFGTRCTGWEESRTLAVTGLLDAACEVTVDDNGCFRWECYPRGCGDPDQMAGRVMRLLAGTSPPPPGGAHARPAPGTGLVGRRLRVCGMAVSLEVYEDHTALDVAAEISVTNPGCPGRGRVLVSDEGALLWECDDEDTAGLAADIAGILAADIAQGCLQRAAPAPARSAAGTR
jgi:hypothetical protein